MNNQNKIKNEIEEKIKTDYRNGDFDNMYCPNCKAYIKDGHDCDNCPFCGTDQ